MPVRRRPKPTNSDEFIKQAEETDIKATPEVISSQSDITPTPKKISNQSDIKDTPKEIPHQSDITPAPRGNSKRGLIQPLKLRIPDDLLESIDALVAEEKPKISRHTWILKALYKAVGGG